MLRLEATKGILFDVDGVLVDSEPVLSKAAVMMFREMGLAVRQDDFIPFIGTGEQQYIGAVAAKYGFSVDIARAKKRLYEIYIETVPGHLNPLPGVHSFIGKCRKKGMRMAVATSADEVKLLANLRETGLSPDTFDALVKGEDVTRKKPAPDIYLLAAEKIGLKPSECLVVEDAPAGIRAAKAAGARVIALTTTFPADEVREADFIFRDLAHIDETIWKT